MQKYILCLDEQYDVELGTYDTEILNNLETMLDNAVELLKIYGVDDEEILDVIKNDTSINITEK